MDFSYAAPPSVNPGDKIDAHCTGVLSNVITELQLSDTYIRCRESREILPVDEAVAVTSATKSLTAPVRQGRSKVRA